MLISELTNENCFFFFFCGKRLKDKQTNNEKGEFASNRMKWHETKKKVKSYQLRVGTKKKSARPRLKPSCVWCLFHL